MMKALLPMKDDRNVERALISCANGHRCAVPTDALHSDRASTYSCPECGVGVSPPSSATSTRSPMQRLLDAAGWDAGSLRHKQVQDALDGAGLELREKTAQPASQLMGDQP